MKYQRISADCHLDMGWLPPDLFVSQASSALKDRMPHIVEGPNGPRWGTDKGSDFGVPAGVGASGHKYVAGKQLRADLMAKTGLYSDGEKGIRRPGDPDLRCKEMDRDGVDAEVIYGVLASVSKIKDPEAANEMLRIYNDFIVDFCQHYPKRHLGLANIPYTDIPAAVKEVHRVAKMGVCGVELSCAWDMVPTYESAWDPLWQAINEVELPVHFHSFPSISPQVLAKSLSGASRPLTFSLISLFNMSSISSILAGLMGATVFERYPKVRVVFGESDFSWLPYLLNRMDNIWTERMRDIPLKMKPSEYWRRQCKATFTTDQLGAKVLGDIGVDTVMWGSDYPHPDGVWPDSSDSIQKQFGHLSPDIVKQITCDNAVRFYGLQST